MGCDNCGYKTCVIALAAIQLAISIIMMAAGIAVFVSFGDIQEFAQATYTLVPASIIIAAGVILFLVGIFGFVGACKENKCMLAIFFVLCGALFIVELVGACLALAMRGDFEKVVLDEFNKFIQSYDGPEVNRKEVDWVQSNYKCCGSTNATDYVTYNITIPPSCCAINATIPAANCTLEVVEALKVPGCATKLHDEFFNNLNIIGGVGLAFAFIQLFALISVLVLLCRRKTHYDVM